MEPGKRPMSSMSPTIFTDENDNFVLGIGAAGGSKITLSTAYVNNYQYIISFILITLFFNFNIRMNVNYNFFVIKLNLSQLNYI